MATADKKITVQYYAVLREQRGISREEISTKADTALALYVELQQFHGFHLSPEFLKVAINGEFCPLESPLNNLDTVVFIPPVAGG